MKTWIALLLLVAAVDAHARTRAVREAPSLDEQTLRAVVLEPLGTVDMQPGEQRTVGLYVWQCCVYPVPVKADVRYSIDPNARATIDPETGRLTINADAYGDSSFRIYADIEHGRRILSADVYVDTRATNPLRGYWKQTGEIPCDGTPERAPVMPILELVFHGDRTYSVTWLPFETYKDYWGPYAFNQPPGRLTLGIRHGNYVPPESHGEGTFAIVEESDGTRRLTVRGMSFGRPRGQSGTDCGAVFVSR